MKIDLNIDVSIVRDFMKNVKKPMREISEAKYTDLLKILLFFAGFVFIWRHF